MSWSSRTRSSSHNMMVHSYFLATQLLLLISIAHGWGNGEERVLLREVKAITLHQGRMTTGRRSSPVPQLRCVGGTAGCSAFVPSTVQQLVKRLMNDVQCLNVGHDGFDAQWECKTDMDKAYKFGKIQVTCEGYDHPNDPYVLRGSCGLEYAIDSTGVQAKSHHHYYAGPDVTSSAGSWWPFIVIMIVVLMLICKMSENGVPHQQPGPGVHHQQPPPYGWKPDHTAAAGAPPPTYNQATNAGGNNNGGGFWTGLGLGGVGGYLFGSRNRGGYNRGYHGNHHHSSGYDNWGTFRSSAHRPSRDSSSSSSGSRTTSGFGGTSRR